MALLFAASLLGILASSCVLLCLRAREDFLRFRAGSLSRAWVTNRGLEILADEDATPLARKMAASMLAFAYAPVSAEELARNAGTGRAESGRSLLDIEQQLGGAKDVLRGMARHSAILAGLQDRTLAPHSRKFVEGHQELDELMGGMQQPPPTGGAANPSHTHSGRRPGPPTDQEVAADLAVNFARVDHGGLASGLMRMFGRNARLA